MRTSVSKLIFFWCFTASTMMAAITGTGTDGVLASTGLTAANTCTMPCDVGNTTVPSGSNRLGLFSVGVHTSGSAWKVHSARSGTVGFAIVSAVRSED